MVECEFVWLFCMLMLACLVVLGGWVDGLFLVLCLVLFC